MNVIATMLVFWSLIPIVFGWWGLIILDNSCTWNSIFLCLRILVVTGAVCFCIFLSYLLCDVYCYEEMEFTNDWIFPGFAIIGTIMTIVPLSIVMVNIDKCVTKSTQADSYKLGAGFVGITVSSILLFASLVVMANNFKNRKERNQILATKKQTSLEKRRLELEAKQRERDTKEQRELEADQEAVRKLREAKEADKKKKEEGEDNKGDNKEGDNKGDNKEGKGDNKGDRKQGDNKEGDILRNKSQNIKMREHRYDKEHVPKDIKSPIIRQNIPKDHIKDIRNKSQNIPKDIRNKSQNDHKTSFYDHKYDNYPTEEFDRRKSQKQQHSPILFDERKKSLADNKGIELLKPKKFQNKQAVELKTVGRKPDTVSTKAQKLFDSLVRHKTHDKVHMNARGRPIRVEGMKPLVPFSPRVR